MILFVILAFFAYMSYFFIPGGDPNILYLFMLLLIILSLNSIYRKLPDKKDDE